MRDQIDLSSHTHDTMDIDYSSPDSQHIIVQRCKECRQRGTNIISSANHVNLVVRLTNRLVVKFGVGVTAAEACALTFASEVLDPAVVQVPSVAQFFTRPAGELWTTGYLVMDFIEGARLDQLSPPESLRFTDRIMQATQHIHSVNGNDCPGPLDGSPARGLLWSEYDSGQVFNSRNDLQRYLDTRLACSKQKVAIDVTNMPLSLCHLDIAPRNIIASSDTSICLLDWGCAGFYPPIFEHWAIQFEACVRGHPLMNALASELAGRSSEREVAALTQVYAANQSIGL